MIPFTQYLRPDGRIRETGISRPADVEAKAQEILNAGYRFECEELHTKDVSLTIFDPEAEEDVAIELVPNGPAVPAAVDKLIMSFELQKEKMK